MHLRELLAVQRGHQLPGPRLGGDEVLRQRDGGVSANIAGGGGEKNWVLNVPEETGDAEMLEEEGGEAYPTTTSWPRCSPRPSTLNTTPSSIRGSGLVKVILAAISLPTTASPKGWWGGGSKVKVSQQVNTTLTETCDVHLDGEVGGAEPEGGLVGEHLLGLVDPPREGEHECGLVHQLVLVLLVGQHPLDGLLCVGEGGRGGNGTVFMEVDFRVLMSSYLRWAGAPRISAPS